MQCTVVGLQLRIVELKEEKKHDLHHSTRNFPFCTGEFFSEFSEPATIKRLRKPNNTQRETRVQTKAEIYIADLLKNQYNHD